MVWWLWNDLHRLQKQNIWWLDHISRQRYHLEFPRHRALGRWLRRRNWIRITRRQKRRTPAAGGQNHHSQATCRNGRKLFGACHGVVDLALGRSVPCAVASMRRPPGPRPFATGIFGTV